MPSKPWPFSRSSLCESTSTTIDDRSIFVTTRREFDWLALANRQVKNAPVTASTRHGETNCLGILDVCGSRTLHHVAFLHWPRRNEDGPSAWLHESPWISAELSPPRAVEGLRGNGSAPIYALWFALVRHPYRLPRDSQVELTSVVSPAARCWQVFGLVSASAITPRFLLPIASQPRGPVLFVGFALTYRCGAAPELHRIPFSVRT